MYVYMNHEDPFSREIDPTALDTELESVMTEEDEDNEYALSEIDRSKMKTTSMHYQR
jgi:hypothetical protein